jgi:hypothetical protein
MNTYAMVEDRDIHDIPPPQWPELKAGLVGTVVEVKILCAHTFGVGVELTAHGAYGHVNPHNISDGDITLEEVSKCIGELRKALVLGAIPGRQPTLTLRPSEIPAD